MGQPKRVWSNKKTVWDGKKSVWLQDGELKTYDGNWEDAGSDLQTYGSEWEEVSDDAILDVYDSNTPEPIGTPEDGIKATYTFKDYDGTVLKTGTVDDGGTPVAPTDPTREATAQYTYTFAGWSPAVGPIVKNTVYTATYTSTVNTYTVNISANDDTYGTLSQASVTGVPYGTSISASDNVLTIGETTVTATAESGYAFSSWGTLPETVTGNLNITATFEAVAPTPSIPTLVNSVIYSYDNEAGTIFYDEDSGVVFEGTQPASLTVDFTGYTDNARVKQMFGVGEVSMNLQRSVMGSINKIDENADNEYSDAGGSYEYQFTSNAWTAIQTFMASDGGEQALTALVAAIGTEASANGGSILTMIP